MAAKMPVRHTRGFKSALHRADHFKAHGARLGIASEEEYEAFAEDFLRPDPPVSVRQFVRPWNGDLVRYDEVVDVFGILGSDRFIKTCYRPDPQFHGAETNLAYYLEEEAKA